MGEGTERDSSRRQFLRQAGALAAAAGLAGCGKEAAAPPPAAQAPGQASAPPANGGDTPAATGKLAKRTLGRTGLEVAVVGVGCGNLSGGPALVRRAVTNGLNYLDTSMCYMGGKSEEIVGQGIKGLRDQVVIATKWDAQANSSKQQILDMLDASLKRLQVDHVDIIQIHQLGDHALGGQADTGLNRLDNPALYEAIEAAKKAGKARFAGATSHVNNRLEILSKAINSGHFDMILVKYNFSEYDSASIPALLKLCKDKNIGVVAMKAQQNNQQVAKLAGQMPDIWQANLRWCLMQGCHTVVNSNVGNSAKHQDLALELARQPLQMTEAEHGLLLQYASAISDEYCRGCHQHCQGVCPAGVRIADVLRYRMYHKHYGDVQQAVARYNALAEHERLAMHCGECNLCTQHCPHGLPVVEQLFEARSLMLA